MKLYLSSTGAKFDHRRSLPPRVLSLKKFLDASKDGELFTTSEVAKEVPIDSSNLCSDRSLLPGYSYKIGTKNYYGNPRTINQLKKEIRNGHKRK